MNAAAVALTVAKSATVKHKANTKHIQAGKERKKGMIAPLNVSKGQENKATSYRFGDDERELTAEEKEAYKMAGNIAEKIHYAGQAAAVALFSKMTYKEFKRAYKLPEWVKPEEYYFFSKSFYQAYCWGYEEGEKEQQFDKEERKKSIAPNGKPLNANRLYICL